MIHFISQLFLQHFLFPVLVLEAVPLFSTAKFGCAGRGRSRGMRSASLCCLHAFRRCKRDPATATNPNRPCRGSMGTAAQGHAQLPLSQAGVYKQPSRLGSDPHVSCVGQAPQQAEAIGTRDIYQRFVLTGKRQE